jgi:hypothetical protein
MADPVNSIDGSLVILSISTNTTTPAYKEVVCSINNGLSGSRDVKATQTKCGTAKSPGSPNYTLSGNFAANKTPGATEISHEVLAGLFDSGADFLFKLAHITAPTDYYRQGTGFLSSYNETANNGEVVQGDFTVEVKGSPDFTS